MSEFAELRQRAESVLASLSPEPAKPIFIEFSGSPKSGKSSCIDIVSHFFRRTGFRVLAPTEGASKRTPYYLKSDWVAFNAWSASYALTHILEGLYSSDRFHLAILDRGLFDALAWFQLLSNQGQMTQEECQKVQDFLLIDKWRSAIDGVFLFQADPDTSMNRENQNTLIDDPGSTMNPDTLEQINQAYNSVRKKYATEFPNFQVVDTSESQKTNSRDTAAFVAGLILDRFNQG